MRIYHFLNHKYGLQALRRKRLKVSLIDQLNDPFELVGFATNNPIERQAFADVKHGLAKYSGMLCFSDRWSNPVQWSHYADRHKGLCLGFDVPNGLLTPVKYRSTRLKPDVQAIKEMQAEDPAAHKMMRDLVATKFSHWRYENEQRLFVGLKDKDTRGQYFCNFSDELALREVVVGSNSTISRADLKKALGRSFEDVMIAKARLAFQSFRVVRQKRESLWK
jgi:Protein of unknown function (DUF2971)